MVTLLEVEVMAVVTEPTLDELEVVAESDAIVVFIEEMPDNMGWGVTDQLHVRDYKKKKKR